MSAIDWELHGVGRDERMVRSGAWHLFGVAVSRLYEAVTTSYAADIASTGMKIFCHAGCFQSFILFRIDDL